jgi:hypothetical protein
MERFGSINAILSQLSDESVLTKWLEQYRNTTEYLESVYGIDLTENGGGKDRDGERGSNQSIAQILESLVSGAGFEDNISLKPLSQLLDGISLYAENSRSFQQRVQSWPRMLITRRLQTLSLGSDHR